LQMPGIFLIFVVAMSDPNGVVLCVRAQTLQVAEGG